MPKLCLRYAQDKWLFVCSFIDMLLDFITALVDVASAVFVYILTDPLAALLCCGPSCVCPGVGSNYFQSWETNYFPHRVGYSCVAVWSVLILVDRIYLVQDVLPNMDNELFDLLNVRQDRHKYLWSATTLTKIHIIVFSFYMNMY